MAKWLMHWIKNFLQRLFFYSYCEKLGVLWFGCCYCFVKHYYENSGCDSCGMGWSHVFKKITQLFNSGYSRSTQKIFSAFKDMTTNWKLYINVYLAGIENPPYCSPVHFNTLLLVRSPVGG